MQLFVGSGVLDVKTQDMACGASRIMKSAAAQHCGVAGWHAAAQRACILTSGAVQDRGVGGRQHAAIRGR